LNTDQIPPVNTTTLVLHFNARPGDPLQLDQTFTVIGQKRGKAMASWIKTIVSEHISSNMDATLEVWHHSLGGVLEQQEITTCRP
jgi:hypothetical protein